jgi:AcrR family transcriptional regulator
MAKNLNTVKTSGSERRSSYHHGDLRDALMAAAEDILQERGATGFSLREAARRAGVSPGAPAHHFGDTKGLLTAVAARGFRSLTERLQMASERAPPDDRVRAIGEAYFEFAQENGPLFGIMWLRDLLDQSNPDYLAAGRAAFNVLEKAALQKDVPITTAQRAPDASVIAAWAIAHGLARLKLDGALDAVPSEALAEVLQAMSTVVEARQPASS